MSLIKSSNIIGMEGSILPNIEALYIHIPFCLKKCNYCDFVSYPVNGLPVKDYCQALITEGSMYSAHLSSSQKEIKSIYIGGGTPTCLSVKYLVQILEQLGNLFPVQKDGEITVECNPQTVNKEYFYQLKKAGVNRLSIGAQAFDPTLLQNMGRMHGVEDIKKAVYDAREAGFTNINLDLIYGLPNQTISKWSNTLANAISLPITHLSVYGLKLSEQSPWGELSSKGCLNLPDEDNSADMQELAMEYLKEQCYDHYEISNFALPGFFSVHNRVYWNNGNYVGLGLSASSHWANIRQTNSTSLISYIKEVENGRFPVADREIADRETEMAETIFLGLRLLSGLVLQTFKQRFQVDLEKKYQKQLKKLRQLGLLEYFEDRIRLTRKGIFLANEVFVEFLP